MGQKALLSAVDTGAREGERGEREREERERERERDWLGLVLTLETSIPPAMAHYLQQSQTTILIASLPGDQALESLSLWGPFLFKPPDYVSFSKAQRHTSQEPTSSS